VTNSIVAPYPYREALDNVGEKLIEGCGIIEHGEVARSRHYEYFEA
jgi:hypothetical protein